MSNEEVYYEHFQRIKILDFMTTMLGNYALSKGYDTFVDYIDMNCGAIPEGNYNQVIDSSAPQEFLSLYTGIAHKRFAFAVNGLLKISSDYFAPIKDFCFRTGKDLKIGAEQITSPRDAFSILCTFILDGMVGEETKEITAETENRVEWKKLVETHGDAWEKAGGKLEIYYELQEAFGNGLINVAGYEYKIQNTEIFSLEKKS
ncbi:MAG: hypothetical protein MJ162_00680 [Treponema sp.]|nr:hypothetical protein [Treponema sp.]